MDLIGYLRLNVGYMEKKEKYIIYARKSTEQEERQVMSIDSQLNEMQQIAEREELDIVGIKQESHSAREQGQRKVFNEIVEELKQEKYNAILTWAPDRLARNAGDLGKLVDLMDQEKLHCIRTFGQTFTNNPNEKFLLMILGSQAKLENDNRSINIRRGIRAKIEKGLWHCAPPTGYEVNPDRRRPGELVIDTQRVEVIKEIFNRYLRGEKIAHIHKWLLNTDFRSRRDKNLSVGNIYTILRNTFYYGEFEYPRGSGEMIKGIHIPLITKQTYDDVQAQLGRSKYKDQKKREFIFNDLIICGYCMEQVKGYVMPRKLKDGTTTEYKYYRCRKKKDYTCKNCQIREDQLLEQVLQMIKDMNIEELAKDSKLADQVQGILQYGAMMGQESETSTNDNIRRYITYVLTKGTLKEKNEMLKNVSNNYSYIDKKLCRVQQ